LRETDETLKTRRHAGKPPTAERIEIMKRRMNAAKSLEAEIRMAFLETHGLTLDDCDWKELMCDCRDDYEEYREWYLACYA
jgi:hypothetical protein